MGNKLVTAFHNDKTDRRPRIPARRPCLPGRHAHLLPTPTGPGPQPRRFRTSRRLQWILTFERYAFPRIGKMPVSEVTSADVLEILAPIWHTKADTARRLRQRIRAVLEWAVAMEFRIDNPCDRIDPVLGPQRDVVQHMRALPHREVAAAIQTARASTVPLAVRLAFEFLVLTAARWGEVRWAEWTEIDRDEGVWTVPARRTKANREHRVPLCGRALEILDEARTLVKGTSPYLFPNRLGKQLEEKQLRRMLGKHKIAAVPHGFRSSFRDWAAEETNHRLSTMVLHRRNCMINSALQML